jgi:hypothetical protein
MQCPHHKAPNQLQQCVHAAQLTTSLVMLPGRGLDNVANEEPISNNMNLEPAAAYFGLSEDEPKPSAIWVLQGFLRAHQVSKCSSVI